MKFPRMVNERTEEKCAALRLEFIPDAPPFVAYQLYGSDTEPVQLDLYHMLPEYDTQPFCVYTLNEEGLMATDYDFAQALPIGKQKRAKKEQQHEPELDAAVSSTAGADQRGLQHHGDDRQIDPMQDRGWQVA